VGTIKDNAILGQTVNHRSACDETTVATECVVTLLIGGNEQNLATH
jgi:hypothetical protein